MMRRGAATSPDTVPLLCLALAVVGYFGPWVGHKTAALTRTGFELSEFAKLFPQVQSGDVRLIRALFFAPPVAAAITLGILLHHHRRGCVVRTTGMIFAGLLTLAAVPPYEYLGNQEYRGNLVLAAGGLLLVLLSPLTRRLSSQVRNGSNAVLAIVGVVPALWQFFLLRPLVAEIYNKPVDLGWGVILCTIGFGALFVCAVVQILQGRPETMSHSAT